MAVDFYHRLVATGPHGSVDLLRRWLRRTCTRTVAGRKWRERVPFSFERLYALVPSAARIEPYIPFDPYDMSVWPIRRLSRGRAEVRYQLHLRDLELLPFVRVLSRKFRPLGFRLMTHCLDDDDIESDRVCDGGVRRWTLPAARHKMHWERARQKFGLSSDDVYEDDDARYFAEETRYEEALDHWDQVSHRRREQTSVRSWRNRPVSRDLQTEQLIVLAAVNEELRAQERGDATRTVAKSGRKRAKPPQGRQARSDSMTKTKRMPRS